MSHPITAPDLTALVGSRLCHDLINPLGAIGNGIELLGMTGDAGGPEMALVQNSVAGATAKLKLLRLAFGATNGDQTCRGADVAEILAAVARGGRLTYHWPKQGDSARRDVRVALLSVMCLETALPVGGEIMVETRDEGWTVHTTSDRLSLDPALWVPLSKRTCPDDLTPAHVHFGVLPQVAEQAGRTLTLSHGADWVAIRF